MRFYWNRLMSPKIIGIDNLKLLRAILVEECDGHAHDAIVVGGDGIDVGHLYRVVVVVAVVAGLAASSRWRE